MLRAIEVLQQRPEYQSQPIEKLPEPAYDLLAKCNLQRELAYNWWVSYHEGIALVTGFRRVKKRKSHFLSGTMPKCASLIQSLAEGRKI